MNTANMLSSLFRHLLPGLQPSEEGLLWRERAEEVGRFADVDCRCHRWYACSVPYNTMRRHQDTSAGGGAKGRCYLQRSSRLREEGLAARRFEGVLQGWTGTYYAIIASVRFHSGRLRSITAM